MTHVVTDACVRCKHTDGVGVCPVDCFQEGPRAKQRKGQHHKLSSLND